MARQAPVDRKMKAVDTIMLKNIAAREEMESPAARLYDDWDNSYAHRATEMPDRYRIDLRNFCMPTPSRVVTSNFGWRWGRNHKGLDIKVYIGDTIRAAFSGKVRVVSYERRIRQLRRHTPQQRSGDHLRAYVEESCEGKPDGACGRGDRSGWKHRT